MKQLNFSHSLRRHHRISDRVSSLTRPLVEAFDLAQFCYFSIDSAGNSAALSTYPAWMEYYMNQSLFTYNPFLKSPELVPEGVYLAKGVKSPAYFNSHKYAESYGIHDSLVMTLKMKNKLVGFSFGLKSDVYKNPHMITEIPFLKSYCEFFLHKASEEIYDLESEPINVIPFIGDSFSSSLENFDGYQKDKLLSLMGIQKPSLSSREKECLRHYLVGETANSMAQKLGLSKRTVESYLENIKMKLGCFSKTDLLKKTKQLLDSGLLSP